MISFRSVFVLSILFLISQKYAFSQPSTFQQIESFAASAMVSCQALERQARVDSVSIEQQLENIDSAIACYNNQRSSALEEPDAALVLGMQAAISAEMLPLQELRQEVNSQKQFLGLSFGIGLGFSASQDNAIDGAEVVNGRIVVTSNREQLPRVIFEFHKFFKLRRSSTGTTTGLGPFIAVASANDDLLSGVGLGIMYGVKTETGENDGFSIGLGAILDGDVKDLAAGFSEGGELPDGESTIRFEEESRWSSMLFFTRTF